MATNMAGTPRSSRDQRLQANAARLAGTLLEVNRLGQQLHGADPVRLAALIETTELALVECFRLLRLVRPQSGENPGQAFQERRQ